MVLFQNLSQRSSPKASDFKAIQSICLTDIPSADDSFSVNNPFMNPVCRMTYQWKVFSVVEI